MTEKIEFSVPGLRHAFVVAARPKSLFSGLCCTAQRGASSVEYALLVVILALALSAAFGPGQFSLFDSTFQFLNDRLETIAASFGSDAGGTSAGSGNGNANNANNANNAINLHGIY